MSSRDSDRSLPSEAAPAVYAGCGRAIGWLLCAVLVFSPWAFGATQNWSIGVMNTTGWILGGLFLMRRFAAWAAEFRRPPSIAVTSMALLTVALLAFVLTSALNAGATYLPREWRLQEHSHVSWLPHSYDGASSWRSFWSYLALAGAFWAAFDWLSDSRRTSSGRTVPHASSRLRLLLWVLCVNGAVLAMEAIIQRTSGTPNLLWIMATHDNKEAVSQFGPYAYRSNAAQYLNLVWPVALGFWWWLYQDRSQSVTRRGLHHVLLPCVVVTAAAALYSLSRGGVAVAGLLLLGGCLCFALRRDAPPSVRWGIVTLAVVILVAGLFIAWTTLGQRLSDRDPLSGRSETYSLAQQMARDYPWFGTGPGTFGSLFQVYRQNPEQYWPEQLHNDWLETRITFGRTGFVLILAALALALTRCFLRGGVPREGGFLAMTALALIGCLAHARFDFPFQICSLEWLFVVLAAVLFSSSRMGVDS